MPKINVAGSAMYYVDRGQGVPVVLLHSYMANAMMWTPQIRALEAHCRVIVPDLWGHGFSASLPQGTADLTALAQHLLPLLDTLEAEKCIVIGQSVGGMLAGELALAFPQRIAATGLISTYLGPEPEVSRLRFLSMLDEVEKSGVFTPERIEELLLIFFASGDNPVAEKLKISYRHLLATFDAGKVIDSIVPIGRMTFNRRDLLARLGELDPETTLIICGEHDTVRPPTESKNMARLIGCPYIEVPDAGHTPNLESAEYITQSLIAFIQKVEAQVCR
ncbi:alpha/beta fold hydrolase [Glaciimonas sp. GG7]